MRQKKLQCTSENSYILGQLRPSEMQKTAPEILGIQSSFAADAMELRTAKPEVKPDESSGGLQLSFAHRERRCHLWAVTSPRVEEMQWMKFPRYAPVSERSTRLEEYLVHSTTQRERRRLWRNDRKWSPRQRACPVGYKTLESKVLKS